MLANFKGEVGSGRLDSEIHLPSTAKYVILDFIARQLSSWRDHPDRPIRQAEDRLTEHLCDYLNSAACRSEVSHIQFRTETGDETKAIRTYDLSIKPSVALVVEGRRSTIFDTLLPIECKRLPTPPGTNRDEREYVFSQHASVGGVQRFKAGDHGAAHKLAAMIGYVQQETCAFWNKRIAKWIDDLVASKQQGWSASDLLRLEHDDIVARVAILRSCHTRSGGRADIDLRHLWVQMS
jgi:hypothetical protein